MSTSGIFTIRQQNKPDIHLYIHHDCYEAGAAHYLREALKFQQGMGGFAERFIRANFDAGLVTSNNGVVDYYWMFTEHTDGGVSVKGLHRNVNHGGLKQCFNGCAESLVNNHKWSDEQADNLYLTPRFGYVSTASIDEHLSSLKSQAEKCIENGWNGNASSHIHDATALIDYIANRKGRTSADTELGKLIRKEFCEIIGKHEPVFVELIEQYMLPAYKGHTLKSFWAIGTSSRKF